MYIFFYSSERLHRFPDPCGIWKSNLSNSDNKLTNFMTLFHVNSNTRINKNTKIHNDIIPTSYFELGSFCLSPVNVAVVLQRLANYITNQTTYQCLREPKSVHIRTKPWVYNTKRISIIVIDIIMFSIISP